MTAQRRYAIFENTTVLIDSLEKSDEIIPPPKAVITPQKNVMIVLASLIVALSIPMNMN